LLDNLDNEINIYAMRVKEWYGWHFPELSRIVGDNILYARIVKLLGSRSNIEKVDLTNILDAETAVAVARAASMSMGTELSNEDISYIQELCDQVLKSNELRNNFRTL